MILEDVLQELVKVLGSKNGGTISWELVREWPEEAIELFQSAGWIKPKASSKSVTCPGCEENCFMPVHVFPAIQGKPVRAFVACDRRDDMGNIPIPLDTLRQWQTTEKQVAGWIGRELGIRNKPKKDKTTRNFLIGDVQGKKKTGPLELVCEKLTSLKASEHLLSLNEVVYFENNGIKIDQEAILNLVNRPSSPDRYKPSNARREAQKLDTQAMYKGWQRAYRKIKKELRDMSDVWYSQQIAKMDIAQGRSEKTIRKEMKK